MNEEIQLNSNLQDLLKARENVKLALTATSDWRNEAKEDYLFVQGKQWGDKDKDNLTKRGRTCITINRCRPMINLISGYATQNAFEPDFLPRGPGDDEICRAAKGVTKFVYDKCGFKREKKKVFRDKLICGTGNYWVYYDFDYDRMDGMIKIERKSPFDVFADPESVKEDLSDAKFCGLFSWEDPDELAAIYPEQSQSIQSIPHKYDEGEEETVKGEPLWYSKEYKKLRLVQYWYKVTSHKTVYELSPGKIVTEDDIASDLTTQLYIQQLGIQGAKIPATEIRFMTFVDNVTLEDKPSPYKHKRFPLVREFAYYTGEKDDDDSLEPAGIIRDLKDVQREVNKQRSQRMDIVNQQVNAGWLMDEDALSPTQEQNLKQHGTTPGVIIKKRPGKAFDRLESGGTISNANIELEKASYEDFYTISGINPETLGYDTPSSMSGRAIELRQKQASVQIADLFDEQQLAERQILDLLWGDKGRPGLIPQYFTEEQTIRILGEDGQNQFINLAPNLEKPMVQQAQVDAMGQPILDKEGNLIQRVLYDLSKFEFDIVINESPATPTQRLSNLYQLMDAQKSGIPIPPTVLLDFMDFPGKTELKEQLKQQAEKPPEPPKTSLNISFADLPVEAKAAIINAFGLNVSPQSIAVQDANKQPPSSRIIQPPQRPSEGAAI